jgi:hypothetical protein
MKKKVLKCFIAKRRDKYCLYVSLKECNGFFVYAYSCYKSALRGARRYAKRYGYTEVKEV